MRSEMTNGNGQHIFIVDDEPKVLEMIGQILETHGMKVSCFTKAKDCLACLDSNECNLLITDLKLPEMDGIELLRRAKNLAPWIPVLIVTGYGDIPTAVECIKAGAADFIEKPLDQSSFVRKAKSALKQNGEQSDSFTDGLTNAEKRVLKLVLDGHSSKDIAQLLKRSRRTIEVHRANAMRKLKVDNLIELIKRGFELGLVKTSVEYCTEERTR